MVPQSPCRYLVVCHHGGVYADADTLSVAPVSHWLTFAATLPGGGATAATAATASAGPAAAAAAGGSSGAVSRAGDGGAAVRPARSTASGTVTTVGGPGGQGGEAGSGSQTHTQNQQPRVEMVVGVENAFGSVAEAKRYTYVRQVRLAGSRSHTHGCGRCSG